MKRVTEVVAALILRDGKFLICKRPENKSRGGLWEFAGGKTEPGETPEDALKRECMEELGIAIETDEVFCDVYHSYPDVDIHLTLFAAHIICGEPVLYEHTQLAWITPSQADRFDFCPADTEIIDKIKRKYGNE